MEYNVYIIKLFCDGKFHEIFSIHERLSEAYGREVLLNEMYKRDNISDKWKAQAIRVKIIETEERCRDYPLQ